MPTYIVLGNHTQQGIANIKDSPARLAATKEAVQAAGGEVKAYYMVMGRYDFVLIVEGPDDETAAKLLIATGAQGNVRTETLKAFTEDKYREIIGASPIPLP